MKSMSKTSKQCCIAIIHSIQTGCMVSKRDFQFPRPSPEPMHFGPQCCETAGQNVVPVCLSVTLAQLVAQSV